MGRASNMPLWWHAYGGADGGVWALAIVGGTPLPPDGIGDAGVPIREVVLPHPLDGSIVHVGSSSEPAPPAPRLVYLASWDHEPTEAEKEAVAPEEFRD